MTPASVVASDAVEGIVQLKDYARFSALFGVHRFLVDDRVRRDEDGDSQVLRDIPATVGKPITLGGDPPLLGIANRVR